MNKNNLIVLFAIFICIPVQSESDWSDYISLECTQDDGERSYHFFLDTKPPHGLKAYWKDILTGNENERAKTYVGPFNIIVEMSYCRDGAERCEQKNWDAIIDRKTLKASITPDYPETYETYSCKKITSLMDDNKI